MKIQVNNGDYLEVKLWEDKYNPEHPVRISIETDDDGITLFESEIVAIYNLVKELYSKNISVEHFLVYSKVYDEIQRLYNIQQIEDIKED